MLKHRSFRYVFHPYITYIKRFSALDTSTAFTTTSASSPAPRRIFHKQQKREPPFIAQDFTNKSQITSPTTALSSLTTTTNERNEENKFHNKFEGTYHFHRRFLCDSIYKEHILNKFEWIRLSRLMKSPYSHIQRLFIQNLFKNHSPTYIRSLFQIWGISMKDIDKYSNNKINFDNIYLQILSNTDKSDNKESMQIMFIMFHKLLYEQQINKKKVIPLNEIVNYINDVYYNYSNLYKYDQNRNQRIKSDIIKILQSFRQFVVHQYKDIDERDKIAFDLTQKNPVISIYSHIGNILQIDNMEQFKQNKYLKKNAKFDKLQDILMQNDFYSVICVMYHIFGVAKNFNDISMQTHTGDHNTVMDLKAEENTLFIPMNTGKDKIIMDENEIILRLDSNVMNILNENKLLTNNIAVILNKLEKNNNKYIFKSKTNIELDGVWSIYNNIQNENDLSLMVLPRDVHKIISAINNRKHKKKNIGTGYDNLFEWLGVNISTLPSRKDNIYNLEFNLITLAGEVMNRRKLWFLLCYVPCTLGSNFMKNDTLNILCWLSSAIKGWEFELHYYKHMCSEKTNKEQDLFEYYCSEYRRIIRDILNCYFREELIAEKGELLISRLAYIYLNDLLPNKWLNEDWFILAKLCPKIIINNEEYAGIKELNGLIFLRESLKKLTNTSTNDIVFKLKLLINDKNFVTRISKSLSGNHECYIEFLESLCDEKDKKKETNIVNSNAIHLFMQHVLLPCADFISAFNLLKFMIKYEITMNINTISLFINICEYANNTNIMYDVYNKLYHTLGDKISNNPQILKSILRMFIKDNKWIWINEIFENIYSNNNNNDGIIALQKCYVQLIDILVALTKNEHNKIIDKELITNLLVDVFNENKYENALNKLLIKTFDEYRQYLYNNNNNNKDNKVMHDKYIVYKMNVLQDLIAKSTNQHLLQHWDKLIVKLRKI